MQAISPSAQLLFRHCPHRGFCDTFGANVRPGQGADVAPAGVLDIEKIKQELKMGEEE
jgi:hypothetical protein